jgi:hypothetical protein
MEQAGEEEEYEEEEHQKQQGEHALKKMSPRGVLLLAFVFIVVILHLNVGRGLLVLG